MAPALRRESRSASRKGRLSKKYAEEDASGASAEFGSLQRKDSLEDVAAKGTLQRHPVRRSTSFLRRRNASEKTETNEDSRSSGAFRRSASDVFASIPKVHLPHRKLGRSKSYVEAEHPGTAQRTRINTMCNRSMTSTAEIVRRHKEISLSGQLPPKEGPPAFVPALAQYFRDLSPRRSSSTSPNSVMVSFEEEAAEHKLEYKASSRLSRVSSGFAGRVVLFEDEVEIVMEQVVIHGIPQIRVEPESTEEFYSVPNSFSSPRRRSVSFTERSHF